MQRLFRFLADTINGAERSFLDFLSAIVPYAVPIIPAYLTYFHTKNQMVFPDRVAWSAAFVVEVLGITAVSTSIRFYRHNTRYSKAERRAPFTLAIFTYIFYLVIVLAVNVVLEMVSGARSGWVIFSIGLFSMLSVPSGILISIRSQFSEMLEDNNRARTGVRIYPAQVEGGKGAQGFTGQSAQKTDKVCACGCGEMFAGRSDKLYKNNAHRMRHQRARDVS